MKTEKVSSKSKSEEKVAKLNKTVWDLPSNDDLVAQALYVYVANQRKGTAHAKTRGEVSGGGRKPYKQKGTGRARQGSIRSPLWVKGGVAFPPRSHKALLKMSKQMKHKAICTALSDLMRSKKVLIESSFSAVKDGKTKELASFLEKIDAKGRAVLLVAREEDNGEKLTRASRNVAQVILRDPLELNIYDVVKAGVLVSVSGAVKVLEERLLQK